MIKRLSLLALIAMLVLAALPSAAQDAAGAIECGTEEEVTVVLAAGAVGQENELTRAGADRFQEACPNVTVEMLETPDLANDRLGLYLQFFEAESSDVDIFQIDVIWPGVLAEHMINLADYIPQEEIDAHFDAIIENNTVDGSLVGIPWFTDAGLLYYRTDLLEKYGLEAPTTWEELETAAMTIQEGERAEGNAEFWGFVWQGNNYEGLVCDALEWQVTEGGGFIVEPDGTISVNNEAAAAAIDRAAGWVGTISPDGVTSYDEEAARNAFQSGNAAFMRNWPYAYSLGNAEDSAVAGLFDVSPLPQGAGGRSAATLGGWQLAVSKYSEHPEAAAAVARYLAGYNEQKFRAIEGSYNPTIETLYQDEEVLEAAPFFGSLFDVFTNAAARPSTVTSTLYPQVSELYSSAVHSVLTGEQDAASALELLELDLQELLGE